MNSKGKIIIFLVLLLTFNILGCTSNINTEVPFLETHERSSYLKINQITLTSFTYEYTPDNVKILLEYQLFVKHEVPEDYYGHMPRNILYKGNVLKLDDFQYLERVDTNFNTKNENITILPDTLKMYDVSSEITIEREKLNGTSAIYFKDAFYEQIPNDSKYKSIKENAAFKIVIYENGELHLYNLN